MLDTVRQVWALQKDESIKHLLVLLFDYFDKTDLVADVDNLCSDRAVCLMHRHDRTVRIYIYTYGHVAGHYGVHVEYPLVALPYSISNPIAYENIPFTKLTGIIETHLDIVTLTGAIE